MAQLNYSKTQCSIHNNIMNIKEGGNMTAARGNYFLIGRLDQHIITIYNQLNTYK